LPCHNCSSASTKTEVCPHQGRAFRCLLLNGFRRPPYAALLFPCESAQHAVQLFLRFQLPNLCSLGLAASLPCSHTRVRATWAYSYLGQATRARAPIAPPAPSVRAPLNTCPHHPLPYAIACTLAPPAQRRSRSCRSSSRTCSTPVRLHRTASAHAGAVRANCSRTHSFCAAQLLLSLSLAVTVALTRRPCSCTCKSRAPELSRRQRSLTPMPVPCHARSYASSPGHQPPAAACSRRLHLTEPHAPEPLSACAPLWLCARLRLPAQRSHTHAPAPRQPHAPAHCRGPPPASAEPCAVRPPRTAARAAAARSGRSAPEPRHLAQPSRTPALGPAPALEPAEPGAACLGRRRREREGSG
jgi:hypothetical protein